jgi:acyl-CoA dehydrogenase
MLLSDRHITYREQVREFMEGVVRPALARCDMTRALSRKEVDELPAEFKVHDIANTVPVLEDGKQDLIASGIFTEELARIDCSMTAIFGALFFANVPMDKLLNEEQRPLYGHLFRPGNVVGVGMSEPQAGSDPSAMQTTAVRQGDGWVINGQKMWLSNASISDALLVGCRLPEEGNSTAIFLVTRDDYAYDPHPVECLGMTAMSTDEVSFAECWVPAIAQVGRTGEGLSKLLGLIESGRINLAFTAIGVAQAALDLASEYARNRQQFGRPIGSFQLVQELIVDMAVDIDAARLLALRAAAVLQTGEPARVEVSMAKLFCTEMAVRAASNGVQVHGGLGLTKDCAAERYYRDARMLTIPDGTTQIHKLMIGRQLLGLSALV